MDRNGTLDTANDTATEFARFLQQGAVQSADGPRGKTLKAWVDLAETYRIVQALRECGGNRSAAARTLGIGRRTLYAKMEKLGISAAWRVD
jgi:DNA-binding NtrC family response regulator